MSGIEETELRVQRILTKRFIEADATTVTLYRSTATSDGAGGTVKGSPSPLPPQVVRVIPLADGSDEQFTADGQRVRPTYMLMGESDLDVQRFDTLTLPTGRFEVVFVSANRQYQVKAEVAYRGA